MITKNRERELPNFANINLLGRCNANCFFCLGRDIKEELKPFEHLSKPFEEWENFGEFLDLCKENSIEKLYITGQTADGLQYNYLHQLVKTLKKLGFKVGVRTNGYLAEKMMNIIQMMDDEIGYSIHSLDSKSNHTIMGRSRILDWDTIIPKSGDNVRVSIVVNRHNIGEFFDLVKYISKFPNVRYIQARRISTDTRLDEHEEDIRLYEELYQEVAKKYPRMDDFYAAQRFNIHGKEVCFWRTVETSANSFNYFTDGTVSTEYFIVEGYLKNRKGSK